MNSKLSKLLALMLAVVMVLGMFAGCGKTEEPAPEEPAEKPAETETEPAPETEKPETEEPAPEAEPASDTLVVGYDYFSQKFNPFFADTSYDQDAVSLTQVGLLASDREGNMLLNAKDGEVVPYNGTDYTYYSVANCEIVENEDGTVTYKFDMRDDVTFSDGTPLTADDVIFSMYVFADPTFTGGATFYAVPIVGMEEYRSGMDTLANLILAAGRENTDFTNWDEAAQTKFWTEWDAAGELAAQAVVDDMVAGYAADYAEGLGMSADEITADTAKQVEFAMKMYGYDTVWKEGDTVSDFWLAIKTNYPTEKEAVEAEFADYSFYELMPSYADEYATGVSVGEGVDHIEGIKKTGDYSLEVTTTKIDPTAIYQLGVTITPMHYYGNPDLYDYDNNMFGFPKGDLSSVHAVETVPLGAGPYVFQSYENNVISYTANDSYFLGAPKIKNIKMQGVQEADKITGMSTDLFDVVVPSFGPEQVDTICAANPNGELVGEKLTTVTTDFLGYGYIGINADNVKVGEDKGSAESCALRRAFATLFSVYRDPIIQAFYGERASVIQYPISNTSWAAPKPSDEGYNLAYSKDADGNVVITADMSQEERVVAAKAAAVSLFKAAGYTYDEASGKFTAAPEGASMEYEIIIPGGGIGDHPAYGILTETKNALEEMGINLIINDPADANELWNAQDAGTCEMWAAAWGATPDPDMYQVYHSNNVVGAEGSTESNKYGIQSDVLDELIMTGRSTTDQAFRKATYKEALETIMMWGVEIPTYQRQECTLFSTERVNIDTIPQDMTPFWKWMSEIEKLELN